MTFVLEAVRSVRGSALVLRYGPSKDSDARILIDCGSDGTYEKYMRARLLQLAMGDLLPVHLVLASRTDPAHLGELVRMLHDIEAGLAPIKVERLWLGHAENETGGLERDRIADLIKTAKRLGIEINGPFNGPGIVADTVALSQGHGLSLEILVPSSPPASQADTAPIILVRKGDQSILLPGDSHALRITRALSGAGYLDTSEARHMDDPFHVNLMAITQQAPDIDLNPNFFSSVTADSYLFTGNGHDGNPSAKTLRAIGAARGDDDYNVYFTITQTPESDASSARRDIDDWITNDMPDGCVAHFREDNDDILSTRVELPA